MISIEERFSEIVGKENVSADSALLASYTGDKSFENPICPRFVVKVKNAVQVENLIRLANETNTPLIPISSGSPHYKGDTAPSVPGCVIVDLSGMKKIMNISRTFRMAVVEPGVTYEELLPALAREGLTLSLPLTPRKNKSVVGSVLETEPRLNALHQWCMLDPLRCTEVTWGDGNRMYTGEAGGAPMDLEKQWKNNQFQWEATGPFMLDYFRMLTGAQGTMGIVTWASLRCEILPQVHRALLVPAQHLEDLFAFSRKVLKNRFSDEFFLLSGSQMAALMGESSAEVEKLRGALPNWIAVVGIVGRDLLPEDRVSAQEADLTDFAQEFNLAPVTQLSRLAAQQVLERISGPCSSTYWKETETGAFQDIFFETTLNQVPAFLAEMETLAQGARPIGVYLQPQNMGVSWHCCFTLYYNASNQWETALTKALFVKASERFSSLGAYYLRPYGIWSALQLNKDAQSCQVLQKLKRIFDPKGILNPGKLRSN